MDIIRRRIKLVKGGYCEQAVNKLWTEMSYRKFEREDDSERLHKEYRSEFNKQEIDDLYIQLEEWGYEMEDEC